MIPLSRAENAIRRAVTTLGAEKIPLSEATGRALAEEIVADMDLPPFDRSQMDGYAVRASDTGAAPVTLTIVGESAAGRGCKGRLKAGEAVRIMTGAPVPKGADAIQIVEKASEFEDSVTLCEPAKKAAHIVRRGSEVKKGKVVLRAGVKLTPRNISIPAAFGYAKVRVARRPRVAIVSTGSEIVSIERMPRQDQIRNSNSVMLKALCEKDGCSAEMLPLVRDDVDSLSLGFANALRSSDVLITTGGVSVGKYDLTKSALEAIGAKIHFEKVRVKPGKPTVFATLGKKLIFGLPGNPVSAAVIYYLLVRPAIRAMQGLSQSGNAWAAAIVDDGVKAAPERDTYLPAAITFDGEGSVHCKRLKWGGSSDFVGFAGADALIALKPGEQAGPGEVVRLLLLDR